VGVAFSDAAKRLTAISWSVLLVVVLPNWSAAGGGPRNVLVVQNRNSQISKEIAAYYMVRRGIPSTNLLTISCSTAEDVSEAECKNNILTPIRNWLTQTANDSEEMKQVKADIDYIVLTKGIPLSAQYARYTSGPLSVTNVMTCLTETQITGAITNPYGPTAQQPVEVAFSHQTPFGGLKLYLVTRLDGYTKQDVFDLIDGSVLATNYGDIALDRMVVSSPASYVQMNDRLTTANNILTARNIPTVFDDSSVFLGWLEGLSGYFSWGSNDSSFNLPAYRSNIFIPGSIADTYVSSGARTFTLPAWGTASLIGDLIPLGCCAVGGFVREPGTYYTTRPEVLFDRYTKGYNVAEAFYMSCPELFWRHVLVADPLMQPFATPPQVTIDNPDVPITGYATISATAYDEQGISKVKFYFDGKYIGSATQPPYSRSLDTTQYTVGPHYVEAIAYEAGNVQTQGVGAAWLTVQNEISNLTYISQAFPSEDGQGVRASSKTVVAGTYSMGGHEFYIEEQGRFSGIRVISDYPVEERDIVTVVGDLVTDPATGERSVQARADGVQVVGYQIEPIRPLAMPNYTVGGGAYNQYTGGVTDGYGLRNIGLLITTWGKVTRSQPGESFFYIDDGYHLNDGSGYIGIKVLSRNYAKPPENSFVTVTGISSCEKQGSRVNRVIKIRGDGDWVIRKNP